MSLKNKNKMMLIDGNSLFYRAYYATQYKNKKMWTNLEGIPINAILVFWKMLHNLLLTYKPTHLMIALDAHGLSFRKKQFPFYKANRKENPKDLIKQFSIFREMLDSIEIEWLENLDLEADDLIASFINQNKEFTNQILIVSSDQDLLQLIEDKVSILIPKTKQDYLLVNNLNFFNLNNIYPKQIIDYKALLGDPSDNIPGATGIGKIGAISLLNKYNDLNNIYKNIDKLNPKLQNILLKERENLYSYQGLVTLYKGFKFFKDFEKYQFNIKKLYTKKALDFYRKYYLNSIINIVVKKSLFDMWND